MQRYQGEHLGTLLSIQVDTPHEIWGVFLEIEKRVEEFEQKYSRFRPGNWLDELNRTGKWILDEDGYAMISYGTQVAQETNGLFDITILPLLESIWYTIEPARNTFKNIGYQNIHVNKQHIELRNGVRIELGWIGKGYMIDVISDMILDAWFDRFLINFWGDIYGNGVWYIGIENPMNTEYIIQEIDIENEAIAVSWGYARRFWDKNHLINPLTGESPASEKIAIVRAKKAMHADVWATIKCIE